MRKRILITVKTYPSISRKYEELVCTAGFDDNGNWIRIYPVPFRRLPYDKQYKKYHWIEIDLIKNTRDFRPESFRPRDIDSPDLIKFGDRVGTENNWAKRKEIVLQNVYDDMSRLISEAKSKGTSLAVYKPATIIDFVIDSTDREWTEKQRSALEQKSLFSSSEKLKIVKKLPYKFSYVFSDNSGKKRKLMNEDWEVGALYWNCLARHKGDEKAACADVRKKYWDDFAKTKDLYFFLGTTLANHQRAPNPFIIIGTFHPKKENQIKLDF
ncbi:hypothetical protein GF406_07040 [candidate division KSB1 bacterium]|nr:hypothetical protein [candidate division KSB1 bacterium]